MGWNKDTIWKLVLIGATILLQTITKIHLIGNNKMRIAKINLNCTQILSSTVDLEYKSNMTLKC